MYLYRLTNTTNGKVYIGATTLPIGRRMGGHKQDAKKGRTSLIAQAIRTHGWKAFTVEILGTAESLDELLEAEAAAIRKFSALHPAGYNRSSFGSNAFRWFPEERKRLSERTKGRTPWNKGKSTGPISDATRRKQRESHLGQKAWNKGIPATAAVRKKLSAMRVGGGNPKARPIEYEGVRYPSIADARRATGLTAMQMKYRLRLGRARYLD